MTRRQEQVLALVAEGFTDQEIAAELGVKMETVKSHMKNLRAALGARNRAHAVAIGMREGLIA